MFSDVVYDGGTGNLIGRNTHADIFEVVLPEFICKSAVSTELVLVHPKGWKRANELSRTQLTYVTKILAVHISFGLISGKIEDN